MVRPHPGPQTLLLSDGDAANLQLLSRALQDQHRLLLADNGPQTLELARQAQPDLIVLDADLPDRSTPEVLQSLKQDRRMAGIPIILTTTPSPADRAFQGLDTLGSLLPQATACLRKPFTRAQVQAQVRLQLVKLRASQSRATQIQIARCLTAAAQHKDDETRQHVLRMAHYTHVLALDTGYDRLAAEDLLHAAPMHDLGKIGIPDSILRKPGPLTPDEWAIMRQHTVMGARIIGEHPDGILRLGASIALSHHEKWDGSGYPNGLAGQDIPHAVRLVTIADVFDALTSARSYKRAWSVDEAVAWMREASGSHFDPELIEVFLNALPRLLDIKAQWSDPDAPS